VIGTALSDPHPSFTDGKLLPIICQSIFTQVYIMCCCYFFIICSAIVHLEGSIILYMDHPPTIFDLYTIPSSPSTKNDEEEDDYDYDDDDDNNGNDEKKKKEKSDEKEKEKEEEEVDIDPVAIRKLFQRIATIFSSSHTSSLLSSPLSQFMLSHPLLSVVFIFFIFFMSSLGQIPFVCVIGLWMNGWMGRGERDQQLIHTLHLPPSSSSQNQHLLDFSEVDHIKLRMEGEILYERDVGLI